MIVVNGAGTALQVKMYVYTVVRRWLNVKGAGGEELNPRHLTVYHYCQVCAKVITILFHPWYRSKFFVAISEFICTVVKNSV